MSESRKVMAGAGDGEDAIDLMDVIDFFTKWWKLILAMGVAGATAAVVYSISLPPVFQAQALVIVAQRPEVFINDADQNGFLAGYRPSRDIESPDILLERMRIPTTYPSEVVAECQFASHAELLSHLNNLSADLNKAAFRFSVQHRSPQLATQCAEALFRMIRAQQADLAKVALENLNFGLAKVQVMLPGAPARLVAPVYAASEPVAPQKRRLIAAWGAGGLFFGVLAALCWTLMAWYRGKLAVRSATHRVGGRHSAGGKPLAMDSRDE